MVCWPRLQHGHAPLRYGPRPPYWRLASQAEAIVDLGRT